MTTNPGQVRVREARAGDAALLIDFNAAMALETEGLTLEREILARGVRAALGDAARGFYCVAELDGRPAGCLMITREWSDWRNGWAWWIQSVYVAPHARRRGVYAALHEHVLALARRAGDVVALRLYVERSNLPAQATYVRQGMAASHYLMFEAAAGLRK
jgi:GNAT superfamily N-acetyltransferase